MSTTTKRLVLAVTWAASIAQRRGLEARRDRLRGRRQLQLARTLTGLAVTLALHGLARPLGS